MRPMEAQPSDFRALALPCPSLHNPCQHVLYWASPLDSRPTTTVVERCWQTPRRTPTFHGHLNPCLLLEGLTMESHHQMAFLVSVGTQDLDILCYPKKLGLSQQRDECEHLVHAPKTQTADSSFSSDKHWPQPCCCTLYMYNDLRRHHPLSRHLLLLKNFLLNPLPSFGNHRVFLVGTNAYQRLVFLLGLSWSYGGHISQPTSVFLELEEDSSLTQHTYQNIIKYWCFLESLDHIIVFSIVP
ncbi:uncharacterized protein CLUP02_08073 [Colletotrichum lupini]|uniref:Uncharacterized protein n=1 Tax=Colletotrichum lupini TaxID=145971 RepID=A0A9Q8WGA3_9PEZI|nr:uncharacterized protein CLUP02_08073 [Colletotrichum lupini]UQC82583.1 hypothetical protein CLUP02_08073 [Colletotrichum lupini]